ncbi:MAG: 1-deoxy-D-xylulose-5-phosphate reductoisomerase, partial [Candidatus Omnitrophota bacterium]
FPALELAYGVLNAGGTMPAALNGANEAAVKLFLSGKIKFNEIVRKVNGVLEKHDNLKSPSLKDIVDTEKWAYEEVLRSC